MDEIIKRVEEKYNLTFRLTELGKQCFIDEYMVISFLDNGYFIMQLDKKTKCHFDERICSKTNISFEELIIQLIDRITDTPEFKEYRIKQRFIQNL